MRASCRIAAPVVTRHDADYHLPMSASEQHGIFRIVERGGPGGRLVLRNESAGRATSIVVAGFRGTSLPGALTDPGIAARADGGSVPGHWRLTSREGVFDFEARTVDRVEEQPSLYHPLHRRFALTARDRFAARALLLALRLPGGARLLRNWHARRGS